MGGVADGGDLGGFIALAGMIFPAGPIVSIIGSWIAFALGVEWLAILFVGLPWAYLLVLGISLLVFFRRGSRSP